MTIFLRTSKGDKIITPPPESLFVDLSPLVQVPRGTYAATQCDLVVQNGMCHLSMTWRRSVAVTYTSHNNCTNILTLPLEYRPKRQINTTGLIITDANVSGASFVRSVANVNCHPNGTLNFWSTVLTHDVGMYYITSFSYQI